MTDHTCSHIDIIQEHGVSICTQCGEELAEVAEVSWAHQQANVNRVQARRVDERSIYPDVESMNFSQNIVAKANALYMQVTQGKPGKSAQIFRGNKRKGIIFACIFHAHKLADQTKSYDSLIKRFGLDKANALGGLKFVSLNAPKNSPIRATYITPTDLIAEIMEQFGASKEQHQEVIALYKSLPKPEKLNRHRPLSVAAAMVYHWIKEKNKPITLADFAQKVELSELTINKIAKEVSMQLSGMQLSGEALDNIAEI
jgi:transcription initiation factor TFIIIB Brf1 subunit/transcription initiation factor TFIIB